MKSKAYSTHIACLCCALLASPVLAVNGDQGNGNPGIAPINSKITTVKSYADLGAEWWQWAVQAPTADNPVLDLTGEKCGVGQEGPVWFLAGTSFGAGSPNSPTVRNCKIPNGKAIFFPVVNVAYFAFLNDPDYQRTAEYVRNATENACDSDSITNLSVTIDGVPIAKVDKFVTTADESPLFQAQLPTDNILRADTTAIPGLMLSPSAHKGLYIYLKPLPTGKHTIKWRATWSCGTENMVYNLEVLKGVSGQVWE